MTEICMFISKIGWKVLKYCFCYFNCKHRKLFLSLPTQWHHFKTFSTFSLHKKGKIEGRKEIKSWLLTSENSKQSKLYNNSMKVGDVISMEWIRGGSGRAAQGKWLCAVAGAKDSIPGGNLSEPTCLKAANNLDVQFGESQLVAAHKDLCVCCDCD